MTTIIANYEAERRAVEQLYQADCECRIVLLRGTSGSGKTTLLRYCLERIPAGQAHVDFDFKSQTPVAEVFHRTGQRLSWERLPTLTRQITQMQESPNIQVEGNQQTGFGNRINVALRADSPVDREHRLALLTDALFDDLRAFSKSVVMVFDTFEKASSETRDWVTGPVLTRAAYSDVVRVVIAGQEIPDPNTIEWGHCCREYGLFGVRDAQHWLPVVEALGRYVPAPDPLSYLAGLCHGLKGVPAEIQKVIEGFPKRRDLS